MKFFFYIILFLITIIKNKKTKKFSIGKDNEKIKKKKIRNKKEGRIYNKRKI